MARGGELNSTEPIEEVELGLQRSCFLKISTGRIGLGSNYKFLGSFGLIFGYMYYESLFKASSCEVKCSLSHLCIGSP
ncbi:hypothetical protein CsSME_00010953 [Camellia sinensis var. sinensis]